MALDIVYINFEEGCPRLHYQGKIYLPEEFPLYVPLADYDYVFIDANGKEKVEEIVIFLDECFERLKGGGIE